MARQTWALIPALLWILALSGTCRSGSSADPVPVYGYTLIDSFPHDPNAFTEGLVYSGGFLYEGTGLYGGSSLRKVVLETGEVVKRRNLSASYFGEGVTVRGDTIYQLTWKSHIGFVYQELEEFDLVDTFAYPTEGWGLTHDDTSLIMSDGTDVIHYLDPDTYDETRQIHVTAQGSPVYNLNELEFIRGRIYANIWYSDYIAVIDPATGAVEAYLDLAGILPGPDPGVLNGIAFEPDSVRLIVTGKKWPTLFEIWVDPLDFAPEIVACGPPSPVCAYIDSPLVFAVSAEDLDAGDSLHYAWSINGVADPGAGDTSYIYTSAVSTVDTVTATVSDGIFSASATWIVYVEIAGLEDDLPDGPDEQRAVALRPIHPNPVRSWAAVEFVVSSSGHARKVDLRIQDVLGRKVVDLLDADLVPSEYRVTWDCMNDGGRRVSPGIYVCRLRAGDETVSRKIVIVE